MGYSNNFKQDKRDFCPFLKEFAKDFLKMHTPISFVNQRKKENNKQNEEQEIIKN